MRNILYISLGLVLIASVCSCSSANCPLNNIVLCNYWFYNDQGTASALNDEITVKTLQPGSHNLYIYRKLGERTLQYNQPRPELIDSGYAETISYVRNDTVLVNKLSNGTKFSVPMSYFGTEDTLIISYSRITSIDTIYIRHEGYTHVEQPECGAYRFHTLSSVRATDKAIDRIEMANPVVNYEEKENIRIYFNRYE